MSDSATATKCAMCEQPIEGASFASDTFKGPVCADCSECIRDGMKQAAYYGRRAGIVGFLPE